MAAVIPHLSKGVLIVSESSITSLPSVTDPLLVAELDTNSANLPLTTAAVTPSILAVLIAVASAATVPVLNETVSLLIVTWLDPALKVNVGFATVPTTVALEFCHSGLPTNTQVLANPEAETDPAL